MKNTNIYSEIGPLKAVILHEPGEELNNLTPKYLEELLFDDIPWLPLAKKEHQAFSQVFKDNGVKVYYLVDLVCESLKNDAIRKEFINQFIEDATIASQTLKEKTIDYLSKIKDNKELILKCMSGIKKNDLENFKYRTLADYVNESPFVTNPIPNLYFTRDPFVLVGNGVVINKMHSKTRRRETIFGDFIFRYHDLFKDVPRYYNRFDDFEIEGGDIMILNEETLIIGVSQRTSPEAIWALSKNIFYNFDTTFKRVLAFTIPKSRTFMHLDTIFTQVDYDKFTIHKGCYNELKIYEITKHPSKANKLSIKPLKEKLEEVLEKYIGKPVTLIPCGGDDLITSDREQWSDGSNCFSIAPGVVVAYERNDVTNKMLESYNIKVITIPSSELSRGRGGPRCMSMPIFRGELK